MDSRVCCRIARGGARPSDRMLLVQCSADEQRSQVLRCWSVSPFCPCECNCIVLVMMFSSHDVNKRCRSSGCEKGTSL